MIGSCKMGIADQNGARCEWKLAVDNGGLCGGGGQVHPEDNFNIINFINVNEDETTALMIGKSLERFRKVAWNVQIVIWILVSIN